MPRNPADFMQEWIADYVDEASVSASIDKLAAQCEADALEEGVTPAAVIEEVGADIRTLISDAIERQWD